MNLHVLNDHHGFFLNLTIKRFIAADAVGDNIFVNLTEDSIYTNPGVQYLKKNILSFRHYIKDVSAIESVTFYPFDFTAIAFLKELKKKYPHVKVRWVFWGYEYYHRPDNMQVNFDDFSSSYYKTQTSFFSNLKKAIAPWVKRLLSVPVFNERDAKKAYDGVTKFYSFLPQDFKNVFQHTPNNGCTYYPISFLSVEEITEGITWGALTNEIMIGHAANPTLNHAEILDSLSSIHFSASLFLTLEYGEEQYRKAIKEKANKLFPGRVTFLENRLEMKVYYQRLSTIGFAIFNFRWQESLGNIIFLAWNGAKLFFKEESSVYKQFVAWDLSVFTIEHHLNEKHVSALLTEEQRKKNKTIIEDLFAEKKVAAYWDVLIKQQ